MQTDITLDSILYDGSCSMHMSWLSSVLNSVALNGLYC
jgi:hypothetical protein